MLDFLACYCYETDFRIDRSKLPEVTSRDTFENRFPTEKLSLFQQSIKQNCFSLNIKREQSQHLLKRPGFLLSHCQTSSLRNHLLLLYLLRDFKKLYAFGISCKLFPRSCKSGSFTTFCT
jgi:hypothetical protein